MAPQQCENQVAVVQVAADGSRRHCTTTGDGLVSADGRVCAEGTLALEVRVELAQHARQHTRVSPRPMQPWFRLRRGARVRACVGLQKVAPTMAASGSCALLQGAKQPRQAFHRTAALQRLQ